MTNHAAPTAHPSSQMMAAAATFRTDGRSAADLYGAEFPVNLRPDIASAPQQSHATQPTLFEQGWAPTPREHAAAPQGFRPGGRSVERVTEPRVKARHGWRARLGLSANSGEKLHAQAAAAAQVSFPAPRLIMVANPKGGAGKTPTTLILAATLAQLRTESTVAWDVNETRGTLGLRAAAARPEATILTVLQHGQWLARPDAAAADLTGMLRRQPDGSLVLASSETATVMAQIGAEHVTFVRYLLEQRFGVLVVDTGNNTAAAGFVATAEAADVLVVPTGPSPDHTSVVWQLLEGLAARPQTAHLVCSAIVVGSSPTGARLPDQDVTELANVVGRVLEVPADAAIARGGRLPYTALSAASRRAWTLVAAAVADVAAQPAVNDATPHYTFTNNSDSAAHDVASALRSDSERRSR